MEQQNKKKTVVTGVIGGDPHVLGISIVSYALEQAGFEAVNLGALVAQEEFVSAAKESKACAIFVSSIYGMGYLDCQGLRQKCEDAGLKDVLLYVGGQLTTSVSEWQDTEEKFKDLGFDRVYPPGTRPDKAVADLKADLERR